MKKIIYSMALILSITFLALNLYSESKTNYEKKFIHNLSNKKFVGKFIQVECYPECNKWYSNIRKTIFIFDGTNKFLFKQTAKDKIIYNGYYEIKLSNNKYSVRIWNKEIDYNWMPFENYSVTNDILVLNNFYGETYTLSR